MAGEDAWLTLKGPGIDRQKEVSRLFITWQNKAAVCLNAG